MSDATRCREYARKHRETADMMLRVWQRDQALQHMLLADELDARAAKLEDASNSSNGSRNER